MKRFLTIEELSEETTLEESLIRFYESEYAERLPDKVLRGNTIFFSNKAVEAFKQVHSFHWDGAGHTEEAGVREKRYARVVAVTSGKGGVGKSNIALNLAIAFQRLGKMALVLDADLGMANIHLLAGIQPKHTLKDVIDSDLPISELIAQGPEGIGIVPGGAGVMALADSTPAMRRQMLASLERMEECADIIIVDTAAGMGAGVRDFLLAADEIIFVLTADITSLADAYGLLKSLKTKEIGSPLYSVVNMINSLKQGVEVAHRFSKCAEQFLGADVENIGYLMKDSTVAASTARRTPYSVFDAKARVSKNTAGIAAALLQNEQKEIKLSSAFKRYMNLLKKEVRTS